MFLEHDELVDALVDLEDQRRQDAQSCQGCFVGVEARVLESEVEEVRSRRDPGAGLPRLALPMGIA